MEYRFLIYCCYSLTNTSICERRVYTTRFWLKYEEEFRKTNDDRSDPAPYRSYGGVD
jgi:hypothetical protein